ncbi:MAG: cytochrome c oxidase subunit II [Caldilineaceae bacterium]|nr:cytochrome c oxidase subunit II [Caldilineaceae bacterium]
MWNQIFPEQASTTAGRVDGIFSVVLGLSLLFAVPVAILIVYFGIKYRRGAYVERFDEAHEGRGSGPTWLLEATWIALLLPLALGIYGWGARLFFDMNELPTQGMDVYVVGKQWMWKFQHPTGQTEINELHVPIHFPVRLTMISEDVIHSFFVPQFRIKQDVVPGRYTTTWFEATETGEFDLYCAEYCGTDHSRMLAKVIVMEPTQYQQWISQRNLGGGTGAIAEGSSGEGAGGEGSPTTMASAGGALFVSQGCTSCHLADGTGEGPSLVGKWGQQVELEGGQVETFDMDYVRRSILDPQGQIVAGYPPVMPTYEGQIDENQLLLLVEYIRSLGQTE